ncbi:MAG: HPr family phosphocarrier protein [Lentisphaeria bacterium]|jgi:phosphotransferase system HPr (HPr) family protein|nr:HPr family phosphocarrier protein [Lentisphaeria bacterium]
MQKRSVTIRNRAGIHCRPSSVILNAVKAEYPCHTFVLTNSRGDSCELNSIMGLLALGLACSDTATLTVEGPDEERAADRIASLLETEYDFPPKN